jgi:hypothetical protein
MSYYNQQLHDCIYGNKTKAIKYTRQLLIEKDLKIKEKTFIDYFRDAEDKYYFNSYSWNRRDGKTNMSSPSIIVLSIHLYTMMISERNSCYNLEYTAGETYYDKVKIKYRGIEVQLNYRNQDEEINLY